MDDPSREVFDNYLPNYARRGKELFRPLADIRTLHLEHMPR